MSSIGPEKKETLYIMSNYIITDLALNCHELYKLYGGNRGTKEPCFLSEQSEETGAVGAIAFPTRESDSTAP